VPARITQTGVTVSTIAPKVVGQVRQGSQSYLIIGVDFTAELKMKPWWKLTGRPPQDGELVLGQTVAARTGLKAGDVFALAGRTYPVAGIMRETGGSEDNGVFTTIATARALTGLNDAWSLVELNVPDPAAVAAALSSALPEANVAEVSQLVQGSKENAERFAAYSLYISILLAGIGILVVVITLAGNVTERSRELGILRAIGFRQGHILALLGREALLISLSGSVPGYLAGIMAPLLIGPLLTQKPFAFAPHLSIGLVSLGCSVLIGILGIAYPAWRVLRLDPADALRFI